MAQPIHADKVFEGGEIVLDFNSFDRCTFNQTALTFHGYGPCEFANCSFNGCHWSFSGPAGLTVEFMTNLYTAGGGTRELISRTLENIRRGVM